MSLRDFFIERVDDQEEDEVRSDYSANSPDAVNDIKVKIPESSQDDFSDYIQKLYISNDLNNFDKSIFKVEELKNNLPSEMPTNTKKQTVLNIMKTVGIALEDVIEDAHSRNQVLVSAEESIKDDIDNQIADATSQIEELKLRIEALQSEIATKQSYLKNIENAIYSEKVRITAAFDFIYNGDGEEE